MNKKIKKRIIVEVTLDIAYYNPLAENDAIRAGLELIRGRGFGCGSNSTYEYAIGKKKVKKPIKISAHEPL